MSVFRDERVRQALQSAIMDEILIDAPGTYRIVVPDKLIDRLEAILTPAEPEDPLADCTCGNRAPPGIDHERFCPLSPFHG